MFVDYDGSIAGNITGDLLLALLVDEASKTANINIVSAGHGILNNRKEGLHRSSNICLVNAGLFCNLIDYICFRHVAGCLPLGTAKLICPPTFKNNIEKF